MSPRELQLLQTLCINIAKNADTHSLKTLCAFLEENHNDIQTLEGLKERVAFPLVLCLKKLTPSHTRIDQTLQEIFKCLSTLFQDKNALDWSFFYNVFIHIFISLSCKDDAKKVADLSEECKEGALGVICNICQTINSEAISHYTSESFRPQLGHAIFICLQIAEKEKSRSLKVKAMKTLRSLGLEDIWPTLDMSASHALSRTFGYFIPGICQGVFRLATGDEIQGHRVSVAALKCLEFFLPLVMSDSFLSTCDPNLGYSDSASLLHRKLFPGERQSPPQRDQKKSKFNIKEPELSKQVNELPSGAYLKTVNIDRKWIILTSERLISLCESLNGLVTHSHWEVRMALVDFTQAILDRCQKALFGCLVTIIEILINLRDDPIPDVSAKAERSITSFRTSIDQDEHAMLLEILQERVYYLATRLPTLVKSQNDAQILCSTNRIFGCLDMMGDAIGHFLQVPNHLERLFRALLILLTVDCSSGELLLERFHMQDELDPLGSKPNLGQNFLFFQSKGIISSVNKITSLLASSERLFYAVETSLKLLNESTHQQKEILLLLNFFIRAAVVTGTSLSEEEKEKMVSSILDSLVLLKFLERPIEILPSESSLDKPITLEVAKTNVVLQSNSLNVIGSCALLMEKNFTIYLSTILCQILEKAGSSNALVSHSANSAVQNIAEACGYSDVSDLIEMSVPYFWFSLSQKLKRLPEHPEAPQVLRYALRGNKGKVKVYLEDLVQDIVDSLDNFHEELSVSLFTILSTYIECLPEQPNLNPNTRNDSKSDKQLTEKEIPIYKYLQEIDEQHSIIQKGLNEEFDPVEPLSAESFKSEFDPSNQPEDEQAQESPPPPRQIELITKILERCSFLLFVKDRKTQLTILQVVEVSIPLLQNWEDQRLPVFHKLWKPLLLRLKDKDFVVILKALQICTLMLESSSDFLRKRFLTDLFPSLLSLLKSQSGESLNKTDKTGYFQSPPFKIQAHILDNFPPLVKFLDLGVLDAIEVMDVLILYLDEHQPKVLLQKACLVLEELSALHADLVWEVLAHCKGSFRIVPHVDCFNPVIIRGYKSPQLSSVVNKIYEELS